MPKRERAARRASSSRYCPQLSKRSARLRGQASLPRSSRAPLRAGGAQARGHAAGVGGPLPTRTPQRRGAPGVKGPHPQGAERPRKGKEGVALVKATYKVSRHYGISDQQARKMTLGEIYMCLGGE